MSQRLRTTSVMASGECNRRELRSHGSLRLASGRYGDKHTAAAAQASGESARGSQTSSRFMTNQTVVRLQGVAVGGVESPQCVVDRTRRERTRVAHRDFGRWHRTCHWRSWYERARPICSSPDSARMVASIGGVGAWHSRSAGRARDRKPSSCGTNVAYALRRRAARKSRNIPFRGPRKLVAVWALGALYLSLGPTLGPRSSIRRTLFGVGWLSSS